MVRYRKNRLIGEIIRHDTTAGLPLFENASVNHAIAATAPRSVPTGTAERNESYRRVVEGGMSESQREVLEAFRRIGGAASDREASIASGLAINIITARRNELVELGLMVSAGVKYDAGTRRNVNAWRVQ